MEAPKLVITDIDGVWTDGGMFYDQTNNEWKKFNTSDSAGVLFLKLLDIPLAIISGEDTEIVRRRAKKLKIEHLHLGVKDKVAVAQELIDNLGISWEEVAFIGDDINDIKLLRKVGFSACPANAADYVAKEADKRIEVRGGDGAFRAFVEYLLTSCGRMDEALQSYLADQG